MNIRQQKYKLNRAKGMNAYRSAINAGYSHNTAIAAYRNIEKRINFNDMLIKHGIDDETIVKVLGQGLNATRVISAMVSANGKDKDANGQSCDFIEIPDYQVRHKYLETVLKLGGKLIEKLDINASVKLVEMRTIEIVRGDSRIPMEFNLG